MKLLLTLIYNFRSCWFYIFVNKCKCVLKKKGSFILPEISVFNGIF